jgi:hypothetical protein
MTTKKTHTTHKAVSKRAKKTAEAIRPLRLKRALIAYVLLVVISAITTIIVVSHTRQQHMLNNPFSNSQRRTAGFTLYFPGRLPAGYNVDAASLDNSVQANIVTFKILNSNGGSIDITEQKPPDNFNFSTFYNALNNKVSFKSQLGTVTSGDIDGDKTHLTNLVTPDHVWILLHTSLNVPQADLMVIFKNLKASE